MSRERLSPIEHGPRDGNSIALTLDADISRFARGSRVPERSKPHRRILDLLRAGHTPATLFLTGTWVETHRQDARMVGADPLFEIGNHSYSHDAFAGPCFGLPVISSVLRKREEVLRGAAVIGAATGRRPRFFRFPGGCHAPEDVELVRSLGAEPVQWDVLAGDTFDHDETSVAERILTEVRPGSIIVMHLSEPRVPIAAEVLEIVLPALRARGMSLVTLTDLLETA